MLRRQGPSTDEDVDVVVVGAGPAAVAALDALAALDAPAGGARIAVLTGAVPSAERRNSLHPKIQAVSLEQAEAAGVAERIAAPDARTRPLFSTAAVGGLANYWGQQFVRWAECDPWPRDAFADFRAYERACARIERLFALEGGEAIEASGFGEGFALARPRLLAASAQGGGTGLTAMRLAFAAAAAGARVIPRRAGRIARAGARWVVEVDDGTRLVASRILLAAGVIGDGQLLLRSFPDLGGLQFTDHTPWLLFTLGATRHFPARLPGPRPFNALTVQRDTPSGCDLFASFYDMRGADLNLLLASTLGRAHPWLRRWPSPPGAGLVTPVQVWTPDTYGRVEIAAAGGSATFVSETPPPDRPDPDLDDFAARLGRLGCRILRRKRTEPAFGYHYHRLRLRPRNGGQWSEVEDFLWERTDGAVVCIDAADLRRIGCRPHTLTVMARALIRARDAVEGRRAASPTEAARRA